MKQDPTLSVQWIKQIFQTSTCCSFLENDHNFIEFLFQTAKNGIEANGCLIHFRNSKTEPFRLLFREGLVHSDIQRISEKIIQTCSELSSPFLQFELGIEKMVALTFPLKNLHFLQGLLSFIRKPGNDVFRETDYCRGEILATVASSMLQLHHFYQTSRNQLKRANILLNRLYIIYEVSNALLKTRDLDKQLFIILTAATVGEGLGFNRAMLLLRDETQQLLHGKMAVGPANAKEAEQIWKYVAHSPVSIQSWFREIIEGKRLPSDHINKIISTIKIHIPKDNGILARTIRENKAFICHDTYMFNQLSDKDKVLFPDGKFASVPLLVDCKSIGLIAVDNCFSHQIITREDVRFLWMIANLTASTIDNALTYNRLLRLNTELKKTRAALLTAEKSSAVGEMSLELAHEIRNPLVAVGGFARKLTQSMPENAPAKKYAEIIQSEAEKLEKILENVLETARMPKLAIQSCNLNKIATDTLEILKFYIEEHNICLELSLSPQQPVVQSDPVYLKQALHNLIRNAIQAQSGGGLIRVETTIDNNIPILRVIDNGPGIEKKLMNEIFSPFFTTKPYGTGLGLHLAQKIMQKCGARIVPSSNKNGGMCFAIYFSSSPMMKGVFHENDPGDR